MAGRWPPGIAGDDVGRAAGDLPVAAVWHG